ncbi:MAG: ABC transporter ATP-binding protein [Saprospirales bacterium]|nr:ABC transporter ATP-binding protein [Saprospirales bacterium]
MIAIEQLHKAYGKLPVLKGISLEFNAPGRITAILGPNGSGKTTLMKAILGMVLPDQGKIMVEGKSIKGQWVYRNRIDYLPQIARFPENLRVRELIAFIHDLRQGETREAALIRLFGLDAHLDKRLGNLSGGTKQKVNLVLAFMYDSPILILDEPTSGLDPIAMIRLKELIQAEKKRGKLILITTHIINFVEEMADEIVFLLEGNIYFRGSQDELKTRVGETSLERAIASILGAEKVELNGKAHLSSQYGDARYGDAKYGDAKYGDARYGDARYGVTTKESL